MYEVEQKYPVADFDGPVAALLQLGAEEAGQVEQVDCYFAHPSRDFAATDEALRIRQVGRQNVVTYKGPKIDLTTKTRREVEAVLADGNESRRVCEELLACLGFTPVATVRKLRRSYRLQVRQASVEAALDNVAHVGRYIELEVLCAESDQPGTPGDQVEQARLVLAELAEKLQLSQPERRSYLELLLEEQGTSLEKA